MKLTEAQRAAVEHRGSNLLVSASAGSGKTEVLARRCVSLVADGRRPCGVDRLLVVTFTRAAAAELRVRIARMLRAEAREVRDAALRRHLQRQEVLVGAAEIGTIDAWCGRIVREHFAEAGVDAEFGVLAEQDAWLLRRQVLDELFDGIHRGTDPVAGPARAWLARVPTADDVFLRRAVARLSGFREHLVNPDAWLARQRARCDAPDAGGVIAAALTEECRFQLEQIEGLLAGEERGGPVAALSRYRDALRAWLDALTAPQRVAEVVEQIAWFKLPRPSGDDDVALLNDVGERWLARRLQKVWSPQVVAELLEHAAASAGLVRTLLDVEARYHKLLGAAKRRRAQYEFADVLRYALDILGEPTGESGRRPTEIANRLQRRYEHILVDEYQDTSPVQVAILRLVTRGSGASNRFMVGDVKQSIYGFRQAEPRLFSELIDACAAGREEGRVQYLADSFRSHARLLAPLDAVFARLFDRALGGTAYGAQERLRAARAEGEPANATLDGRPRVEVHLLAQARGAAGGDEDEEVAVERIEREAQLAAEQIASLLGEGVQVAERRADGQAALRPLRLRDIAVLLRSARQNAGLVARVLRDNGIPCATGGREALLESIEVRDVRNVLALLVNRRQDVALAAYLRSPLAASADRPDGSLTAPELLAIRRAAEGLRGEFWGAVERCLEAHADERLTCRLRAALARLDRWSRLARELELPALVRQILHDSALVLFVRGLPGGAQREANLRAMQAFAVQFAAARQGGVAEFVEYLDALAVDEVEPGALGIGEEDVVRVMTIHGAKGLEYPVVLLLGAGAKFNEQSQHEALQCDEEVGLGLRFADYPSRREVIGARHPVIRRRVAQRELEEELRLLYVAATRAREKLVVIGHSVDDAWESHQARYAQQGPLALISRMSVRNRLEWLLMAAAAERLHEASAGAVPLVHVQTHAAEAIPVARATRAAEVPPADEPEAVDKAWIERACRLLRTGVDDTLSRQPAVLSVSALKEMALREPGGDRPQVLDGGGAHLSVPAFAGRGLAADGRSLGLAWHRFLELADLGRLREVADVRGQINSLVRAGRMQRDEAALVDAEDIAWLASTAEGCLLAQNAGTARREVPFVYALPLEVAGEHTIVRGVIDCLIETPAGLVILDYKTDVLGDERELEGRLQGYRVQMRLYAQAAGRIFERAVSRAALVFLRLRRVVDVPLTEPALADLRRVVAGGPVGDADPDWA